MFKAPIICLAFFLCARSCFAEAAHLNGTNTNSIICFPSDSVETAGHNTRHSKRLEKKENKKLIAAILAFPLPFGVLGLHRIYLGTKPYMPFVYIGTAGGCFGILPLIDFITIISSKKESIKKFENNRKVFMWSH